MTSPLGTTIILTHCFWLLARYYLQTLPLSLLQEMRETASSRSSGELNELENNGAEMAEDKPSRFPSKDIWSALEELVNDIDKDNFANAKPDAHSQNGPAGYNSHSAVKMGNRKNKAI